MLLGALCLLATWPVFFLFVCAWKLSAEGLSVPAQAYGAWWEVIERGSSDAAPLVVDRRAPGACRPRGHRPGVDPPPLVAHVDER
jgi:hypothetical protein